MIFTQKKHDFLANYQIFRAAYFLQHYHNIRPMLTMKDVVQIALTKDEIITCLEKTKQNHFIDNLRHRHPNVQFDCKLRGYVGELAMKKWFEQNGIELEKTNYLENDGNIDIDFLVKGKNIELKTSLIPNKYGNLETVIKKCDIKLIKRGIANIEQLQGDVHLQIYYTQKREDKDRWLKNQRINFSASNEELYAAFRADCFLHSTSFVAWIDKPALIQKINSLPTDQRTWSYAQRDFWNCKLYQSKKPMELINYLESV